MRLPRSATSCAQRLRQGVILIVEAIAIVLGAGLVNHGLAALPADGLPAADGEQAQ